MSKAQRFIAAYNFTKILPTAGIDPDKGHLRVCDDAILYHSNEYDADVVITPDNRSWEILVDGAPRGFHRQVLEDWLTAHLTGV